MPWIKSKDGSMGYKASHIYFKADLPTNAEFLDFVEAKNYSYTYSEELEVDRYWEVHKQKRLLSVCCNQLNKIIFEDGLKDKLIEYLNGVNNDKYTDVRFIIGDYEAMSECVINIKIAHMMTDTPPNVYYVKKVANDPFVSISKHKRTDITDWTTFKLVMLATRNKGGMHIHDYITDTETIYESIKALIK
jgi:hypothetical protein